MGVGWGGGSSCGSEGAAAPQAGVNLAAVSVRAHQDVRLDGLHFPFLQKLEHGGHAPRRAAPRPD